jgi:hypothetical protein
VLFGKGTKGKERGNRTGVREKTNANQTRLKTSVIAVEEATKRIIERQMKQRRLK